MQDRSPSLPLGLWFVFSTVGLAVAHVWVARQATRRFAHVAAIRPAHKVLYVAADLIKASVLLAFLCSSAWWRVLERIYGASGHQGWDDPNVRATVRWFAVTYGATDASQFFTVKMAASTQVHHAITTAFAVMLALQPLHAPLHPCSKALLWYGMCSTTAYMVNAYKALRVVITPHRGVMERLRLGAAFIYAAELAVNWVVHTLYIASAYQVCYLVTTVVYVCFTLALMRDDFKLLAFLVRPPPAPVHRAAADLESAPFVVETRSLT